MDFDNRKVYGDTSITDGLVLVAMDVMVVMITIIMVDMVIRTDRTTRTDRTDRADKSEKTDLTFKLDFSGNLCRAAFAILALFLTTTNPRLRPPKGHPSLLSHGTNLFLWATLQIFHCRCDFAGFHADFHDILSSSPSSSERRLKLPKKKFALKLVLLPWRQANLQDS